MVIAYHEFNCLSLFDSSYEDTIVDDDDIKFLILEEVGKNRLKNPSRRRGGNRGGNLIVNEESRFYDESDKKAVGSEVFESHEVLEDSESFQDVEVSLEL